MSYVTRALSFYRRHAVAAAGRVGVFCGAYERACVVKFLVSRGGAPA